MPLSSLRETAARDASFVSKRNGGMRCCSRLLEKRKHKMPLSSLREMAEIDAAFVS